MTTDKISRRTLGGLAAAGVGAPLLVACGDDADSGADPAGRPSSSAPEAPASSAAPTQDAPTQGETSGGAPAGDALTTTADIEVGGGAIFEEQEVVVTQPAEGEFRCFTAICSHQGCLVTSVSDGTINCDCHGSKYDIETGDVVEGPATFALGAEPITVTGDQISLG